MANLRLYIPSYIKSVYRNIENEQSILATAICSFIASLFANTATGTNGLLKNVPLILDIPLFIAVFLLLYWIYVVARNRYASSRFYRNKRLNKYDICRVVNDIILDDVLSMICEIALFDNDNIRRIQYQGCLYNIDIILEYIEANVDKSLIQEYNLKDNPTGRAYSRITRHQMECILCGIMYILSKAQESINYSQNGQARAYHIALIEKTREIANNILNIADLNNSVFTFFDMHGKFKT